MTPNAILEFILDLLRNHEAAVAYCANPTQALAAAGLSAVTPEDIALCAPMVAESALVTGGSQLQSIVAAGAQTGAAAAVGAASTVGAAAVADAGVDLGADLGVDLGAGGGADVDLGVGTGVDVGAGLYTAIETGL
ncbi:IniB N-terminal domain-containing protein, partial [Nocardia niwae]